MATVTIDQLVSVPDTDLELTVRAGRDGLDRGLTACRVEKAGLALTGYADELERDALIVLGVTEIGYFASLDEAQRGPGVRALMSAEPACIVVTAGLAPPEELVESCEQRRVPLLSTPLATGELVSRVCSYLGEKLAPAASLHGVLLDVLGVGVLLLGKSGIGKSETALDLVARGHRLVADDIVDIRQKGRSFIYGSGSGIIRHHMEVRGLGIINIKDLFGISAVRDTKKIELVIELVEWSEDEEYERLGLEEQYQRILETDIPKLRLPVRHGRNIAIIIEVAARNQLLKFQGHNAARVFKEQLNRAIAEAKPQSFDVDLVE